LSLRAPASRGIVRVVCVCVQTTSRERAIARCTLGGDIDIVIELVVATERDDTDLRKDSWSIALDRDALGGLGL
jgi:hypothetical protein